MERHNGELTVPLPDEFAPLLTTWAATANISIDELVAQLLADALKIKKRLEYQLNIAIRVTTTTKGSSAYERL